MKRSTFLKSMILAITAPSILIHASPTKDIVPPSPANAAPNLHSDHLIIYIKGPCQARMGDLIQSDLGDIAFIRAVSQYGTLGQGAHAELTTQLHCVPVMMNTYRYNNLNKFRIMANAFQETKNHNPCSTNPSTAAN